MAAAKNSSNGKTELKDLDREIDKLRSAKKQLFEKARPINDELEGIRQREQELVEKRHRLTNEQHYREKHQQTVHRLSVLEAQP